MINQPKIKIITDRIIKPATNNDHNNSEICSIETANDGNRILDEIVNNSSNQINNQKKIF